MSRFISGAGLALLIAGPIHGQTSAKPEFEVVSIKPAPPYDGVGRRISIQGGPGSKDPTLFTCENCSVGMLIASAYELKRYQLTEGQSSFDTRFLVSARVPEGATKEQFHLMQQAMLADRFGLKVHWEKKETSLYELVVAKGGPKLKESGEPQPEADAPPAPRVSGGLLTDKEGYPALVPGSGPRMAIVRGKARYQSSNGSMDGLAGFLSNQLNKPVTDATGLKGKYEVILSWDASGVGTSTESDIDKGPTLFAALQQQLGLKLEQKKGMVDVLVIDKIEKTPTEN